MVLIRVDLPQPLGPRMAMCSPLEMRREISSSTTFSPRATEACSRSTKLPRSEVITKSLKLTETAALVTCDLGRLHARTRADEENSRGLVKGLQVFVHGSRIERGGGCGEPRAGVRDEFEPVEIGPMGKRIAAISDGARGNLGEQRVPKAAAAI